MPDETGTLDWWLVDDEQPTRFDGGAVTACLVFGSIAVAYVGIGILIGWLLWGGAS